MDRFRFSDTKLKTLPLSPSTSKQDTYRDTDVRGLCLVVSASKKVFRLHKRLPGTNKIRNIRIGEFDPEVHWNTEKARAQARVLLSQIDQGKDPVQELASKKISEKIVTLREARDAYINDQLQSKHMKEATAQSKYRYDFELYAKGLLDSPITEVTSKNIEKEIRKLLEEKPDRHTSLGIFLRSLSAVLNYANARFSTEVTRIFMENPVLAVRRLRLLKRSKPRARVLYEHELPIFFEYVYSRSSFVSPVHTVNADYLLFILLTGARRGEASKLQWKDVHADYVIFRGTKTGDDRQVPLPIFLIELLAKRKKVSKPENPWVFLGPSGPISEPKNMLQRFLKNHAEIPAFSIHDLRRTFSTYAKMSVPSVLVSQLTGHKERRGTEDTHYSSFTNQHLREGIEKIVSGLLEKCRHRSFF